jgi:transcriptional regulator of NAD metabolism
MAEPAYRVDLEDQDLVVRVRRDLVDREEVSRFLDFLEMESIRKRSQLTDADAAALADEIDRSVWERNRFRVHG